MPGRTKPKTEISPLYTLIGKAIRSAREAASLSQEDLARAVELSRTSITNLENGNQQVPLHTLYDIASALGVDVRELLPEAQPTVDAPTFGAEDIDRWSAQLREDRVRAASK